MACRIPGGILTYPDELFTAERSREMLLLGRDTVHFNFRKTFAKPPLQYWLTTLSLPHFSNPSVAVRIWPVIYGLLTAVAVGWLAWLLDPKRPWLIPLSVAIYVSCPLFATEATRALLDTGLTLFVTLAIGFAELARRNPAWWLGVAVVCWLGALQKIPLIFLIWLIIVIVRLIEPSERASLRNLWLPVSVLLATLLVSLWPVWQFLQHGMPLTRAFAGDDLPGLLGRGHLGARPYFEVLDGLVASGWAGGSFALIAAALFLKRAPNRGVREIAVIALMVVTLAILFNFRSVRYVLPIVPGLSLVLAFALYYLLERPSGMRRLTAVFAGLLIVGGFVQAAIKMHHRAAEPVAELRAAQRLGQLQSPDTRMILLDGAGKNRQLRSIAFYLFHGNLRFPIRRRSFEELGEEGLEKPPIGVCTTRDLPRLLSIYPNATTEKLEGSIVCWRATTAP